MKKLILTIAILLMFPCVCWAGIDNPVLNMPLVAKTMNGPTTAKDFGSGANDGTLVNAPVPTSNGMTFDGVDQYVNCGEMAEIEGATAFSLSAWINFGSGSQDYPQIVAQDAANTYNFAINRNDSLLYIYVNGESFSTPNSSITSGTLYHVAFTYDSAGAGLGILYIDADESARDDTFSGSAVGTTTNDMHIGFYHSGSANHYFPGTISDVRIYDRALTQEDVTALYNLGRTSQQGDIKGVGASGAGIN